MKNAFLFGYLRSSLCLGIIALAPLMLCGQDARFRIERVSTHKGLLQSGVYCVMQDHYGFIWFGTVSGIERYDGYDIHSYHRDPLNTSGLSDYKVIAIAEDSAGYIWAGTEQGGLNRLDRRTGRFTRFLHDPQNANSISDDHITSLVADRDGGMWIGTYDGLDRFDTHTGRIVHYDKSFRAGFADIFRSSLYCDRQGNIWVCIRLHDPKATGAEDHSTISRYNRATDSFRTWPIASDNRVPNILDEQPDGMLDIGFGYFSPAGSAPLYRFDPATGALQALDIPYRLGEAGTYRSGFALMVDETGDCWYAARAGADRMQGGHWLYSLFYEPTVKFDARYLTQRGMSGRSFPLRPILTGRPNVAFRDRSGTIWIGMDDGVVRISRIGSGFATWRHDPNNATTLSAQRIRAVQVDRRGTLWVGTDHGLNRYDPVSGEWRRYFSDPLQPGSLPNSTVNVIYQDRDGTLLFGTNGGLAAYNQQSQRFKDLVPTFRSSDGSPAAVWSLLRDRAGRLWIGTLYGLALYDSAGKLLHWFRHDAAVPGSILDGGIWCLLEDRRGTIWIGTNEGLCRWMPERSEFRSYVHQPEHRRSLGGKRIWALYEDSAGDIWASSFGGGISRYSSKGDDFTTITTEDGLADNRVFGLLEDSLGVFWISTLRGLVRWDRRVNTFRVYDEEDGLQGDEFAFKAFFKGDDGTLYFGGVRGLTAFKPSDLSDNPFAPPIAITGFHLFDSLVASRLFDGDTVRLTHLQNFFSFDFAALDYINPGKNRYAYMLNGIDPDWVHTASDHRVASYTDLDPGAYTFHVCGSNNDGIWNEQGITVTVIIASPWWGTWWFRIAATVTLIALVVVGMRIRINGVRRHERERLESAVQATLESQETERQRIARDLHDGIGQLLAAAGINLTRLREMIGRHSLTEHHAAELQGSLERMTGILGHASDDVRALSHALGTSTLRELGFVAALGELLSNIEAHEKTRFELVMVGMDDRLPEPIETGLFRVAQELITNVLRHSAATEATVQIVSEGDEVRLSVEDNGTGFDVNAINGGMGHRNIAVRVAAMGGQLHYDSMPGHGTTVTVVVKEEK